MFCMIILVGTVSAFDFDNSLRYEKQDMKVTFENVWGLPFFGSDLGTAELKSHSSVNEIKKVGAGNQVVMWYDFDFKNKYKDGLGIVYFTNKKNGEIIDRDFEYVYVFVKNTKKYWFEQQFERSTTEFIYSRNSKKGETQEKNNPRKNWGNTREELNGYNSKYKNYEHGQTLQGFIRTDSIKRERDQSRIDAKKLFPHDKRKQQDYIDHVHDHGKTSALGRNKRTVWTIPTKSNPAAHFATFPPNLVIPMIKSGCPVDGIVLDQFAGTGTTLKEAWKLGRNYIGFEISKEYCEEIAKDFLDFTKNKRLDDFLK